MPKRPDGENILSKFRGVSLDQEVEHTGFTMLQVEDDELGNKRFEVHYTAVVTIAQNNKDEDISDTDETDTLTKDTKIDVSKASAPNFLNKLK